VDLTYLAVPYELTARPTFEKYPIGSLESGLRSPLTDDAAIIRSSMHSPREEILIVRLAALGDLVTSSTLLTRIAAERPGARVTWVCGRAGAPIVRLYDGVDEVIEVDERRLIGGSRAQQALALIKVWARLLGRRYDVVLIAHVDRRYRSIVWPVRASLVRMLDLSVPGRSNPIPGRFIGDEIARLLDPPEANGFRALAYDVADVRARMSMIELPADVKAEVDRGIDVVLVPGGARNVLRDSPLRRWPVDRYAALAGTLTAQGARVAIVGDAGDAWVRPAFEGVPVVDLIGRLDIPQTMAVMNAAAVVVSHDTGPLHFARLVRTHLVGLFGPTAPRAMIGEPDRATILWGGANLPCRPCYDGREFPNCPRNVCMEQISVAAVVDAVRAALPAADAAGRAHAISFGSGSAPTR
jgi:heptosyltransferase II